MNSFTNVLMGNFEPYKSIRSEKQFFQFFHRKRECLKGTKGSANFDSFRFLDSRISALTCLISSFRSQKIKSHSRVLFDRSCFRFNPCITTRSIAKFEKPILIVERQCSNSFFAGSTGLISLNKFSCQNFLHLMP